MTGYGLLLIVVVFTIASIITDRQIARVITKMTGLEPTASESLILARLMMRAEMSSIVSGAAFWALVPIAIRAIAHFVMNP